MRLSWAIAIVLLIGCCWSVITIASAAEDRAADRERRLSILRSWEASTRSTISNPVSLS